MHTEKSHCCTCSITRVGSLQRNESIRMRHHVVAVRSGMGIPTCVVTPATWSGADQRRLRAFPEVDAPMLSGFMGSVLAATEETAAISSDRALLDSGTVVTLIGDRDNVLAGRSLLAARWVSEMQTSPTERLWQRRR